MPIIREKLQNPNAQRLWYIGDAFRVGMTTEEIYQLSGIDPWFLEKIREIVAAENDIQACRGNMEELSRELLRSWKQMGFADFRLALLTNSTEGENPETAQRKKGSRRCSALWIPAAPSSPPSHPISIRPTKGRTNPNPTERKKIMILGGGPNRIGQGIEFDYCCVHAAFALKDEGYETIMVNCNPETVSTDYDTSDKLYFEPLTMEEVLNIVEAGKSRRRDCSVRRANTLEARAAFGAGGSKDHRNFARQHRFG